MVKKHVVHPTVDSPIEKHEESQHQDGKIHHGLFHETIGGSMVLSRVEVKEEMDKVKEVEEKLSLNFKNKVKIDSIDI